MIGVGVIRANLLIAANGATTLEGRSAPLSSGEDRGRFHELRAASDLIVIGGRTARIEPYEKTPCELVVLTRSDGLGRAATNPLAHISHLAIEEVLRSAREAGREILIEAGASLLTQATSAGLVDYLHITRTDRLGDGDFIDYLRLVSGFNLVSEEQSGGEIFQIWKKSGNLH